MKHICECGHPETDHVDFGFRRCAKQNCPCDQYIEDDDAIQWGDGLESGKMIIGLGIMIAALVVLIECLGKPTEVEALSNRRIHTPIDTAILDSVHSRGCPKGCTCGLDAVIIECPDLRPPGGPK